MEYGRFNVRISQFQKLRNPQQPALRWHRYSSNLPFFGAAREVLRQGWNSWGEPSVIFSLRSVRRQNHNWDDRLKEQIFKNKYSFLPYPQNSWIHCSFSTSCLLRNLTREVVTSHIMEVSIMLISRVVLSSFPQNINDTEEKQI